jgi:hypothetical protein
VGIIFYLTTNSLYSLGDGHYVSGFSVMSGY